MIKPSSCLGCPLHVTGEGWVPAELRPADILIVGEAPGEQEAKLGRPFVGASGWLLERLLRRLGLERERFAIHNCLSCRPPNNELVGQPWAGAALTQCKPNLLRTIEMVQPKVILALGGTALQNLTGMTKINSVRGFPLRGPNGIWVVPTFHPSFLLPRKGAVANAHLYGAVIHDIKRAVEISEGGFSRMEPPLFLDPSPGAWNSEVERLLSCRMLSVDIETPMKSKIQDEEEMLEIDSTILRISFCGETGASVSIPWQAPYLLGIRRLLASDTVKVWWNGYAFDVPVLESHGYVVNGPQWDGMWAFAVLQSALPRGLQNVASYFAPEIGPWKHLSSAEPARYNAIDAYAAMQNMLGIEEALRAQGRWEVFLEHVVKAWVPLKQGGKINGVHIDVEAQGRLRAELVARETELVDASQEMVPPALLPRKRYKKLPKSSTGTMELSPMDDYSSLLSFDGRRFLIDTTRGKTTKCSVCGEEGVTKGKHLKGGKKNPCAGAEILKVDGNIEVYDELLPFNPCSEKQVKRYIKHFGHPMKVNWKTKKETSDKQLIQRLVRKFGKTHPIYALVEELSGITKTKGTYVDGFAPDETGRIYSEYTFAASTGRLTARNVNAQNITHNSDNIWAARIRETIIPPPGCVFVEVDSSALEAVLVGYFMGDPEYIERARAGIHAYLATVELGMEFNPETIAWVKENQKPLYARKKRTVHGVSYGMTARLMTGTYPHIFKSEASAQREIDFFHSVCPRLPEWHREVREQAHRAGYLQNPFGYRHYFYDVLHKRPDGEVAMGSDSNRVVAYLPQSTGGAFMRSNLAILGESEWLPYVPATLSCHDSLTIAPQRERAEEAIDYLMTLMNRPIPELGGLRIGAEAKLYLHHWGEGESVRII